MARVAPTESEINAVEGRGSGWAWGLCWIMFASTVLCYMDRQAMALVRPKIAAEFHVRYEDFGWVLAAFSLSYALFQVPAGYLADRWDVRRTYAFAVAFWSLAAMATALAPSLGALMVCRALLGVGESFNWPCASRITARVLEPADRGLGSGIFNSGAAVGAVLSPLVVTLTAAWFGWRAAFVIIGALGFIWIIAWLALVPSTRADLFAGRLTKPPPDDLDAVGGARVGLSTRARVVFGGLTAASVLVAVLFSFWRGIVWIPVGAGDGRLYRLGIGGFGPGHGLRAVWWGITIWIAGLFAAGWLLPAQDLKGADWAVSLGEMVRIRRFWVVVPISITVNLCWHFLVNWLPSYLQDDRGMEFLKGGLYSAIPFLVAGLGNLAAGFAAQWLARRGLSPHRARLWVLAACAVLVSCGTWVWWVESNALVMVLLALMALGSAGSLALYLAFCQDVSARHTGFVVGILGGLGNLFVAGFLPEAGRVKDQFGGFGPVFVLVGLLPFLGLAILALGWGRSEAEKAG